MFVQPRHAEEVPDIVVAVHDFEFGVHVPSGQHFDEYHEYSQADGIDILDVFEIKPVFFSTGFHKIHEYFF